MNPIIEDIINLPRQICYNTDNMLIKLFRPITKKLDEKNTRIKYAISFVPAVSNGYLKPFNFDFYPFSYNFNTLVISSIHQIHHYYSWYRFIDNDHLGYTQENGMKKITDIYNYYSNLWAKKQD